MLLAGIGTSVESCFKESPPHYNTNSLIHHDPFMLAYFLLAIIGAKSTAVIK